MKFTIDEEYNVFREDGQLLFNEVIIADMMQIHGLGVQEIQDTLEYMNQDEESIQAMEEYFDELSVYELYNKFPPSEVAGSPEFNGVFEDADSFDTEYD